MIISNYNLTNYRNQQIITCPINKKNNLSQKKYIDRNIDFRGLPDSSNIILNYKNDVPKFIYPIDVARAILGYDNIYDMAIGNPDIQAPQTALNKLYQISQDGKSHRYSSPIGTQNYRETIANWYGKRFNVHSLDPDKNIIATCGGANGIDLLLMSYCNAGDKILIPNIGYPVYRDLAVKNNLEADSYRMDSDNNYQIDFNDLEKMDLSNTKAMIINYPHNPTGSFGTDETFEKALEFCKKHDLLLIHDFDSSELTYSGKLPRSIIEFDPKGENSAVVHTMSKSHNMPGMRVGFIVSNPQTIQNVFAVKNVSELGTYVAIQEAAAKALQDTEYIDKVNEAYRQRKDFMCRNLNELGANIKPSEGTYYMWLKVPEGYTDEEFSRYLLYKGGIAMTPGRTFDPNDKSHVRIVMSQSVENLEKVFKNLRKNNIRFDVPKYELSQELIDDINSYSHPIYLMNPMDISDYQLNLLKKIEQLKNNYLGQPEKYKRLLPSLDYIYNSTNVQRPKYHAINLKTGKKEELFTHEILPFSSKEKYDKLKEILDKQWITYQKEHPEAKLLNSWSKLEFFPEYTYITINDANGKIQSIIGFKKTADGTIRSRLLNTAPWNQTKDVEFKHAGKIAMIAECNYALECGIDRVCFEVAPHHVDFYKRKLDATEDGQIIFNNKEYTKLIIPLDNPKVKQFVNQMSGKE